jgi:uncharacterized protein
MGSKWIKYLFLLALSFNYLKLNAQIADDIPERPKAQTLLTNLSTSAKDLLSSSETEALEKKLRAFSDSTSNQIAIVILDDTKGYDANDFGARLGEKWGIGKDDKDNGVVLLVINPNKVPEFGRRTLAIQVGYGLEDVIPDLATKQIRDNDIIPYFKNNNFYEGLDRGTNVLMDLAVGKYKFKKETKNRLGSNAIFIVILLLIIFIFIIRNSGGGTTYTSRGIFWGGLGGWGGGGSSWGGGNSDSGSSWGGFGGGDFGGGGSSGDW